MTSIDGRGIADRLLASLALRPVPSGSFAAVLVEGDAASHSFVSRKRAACDRLKIPFRLHEFPADASPADIEACIRELCADASVRAIVLQLPLPPGFDRDLLVAAIDVRKDVDDLTGCASVESPAVGCAKEILASEGMRIQDFKNITVVGAGFLVGRPIASWIARLGIPLSIVDIDTPNPDSFMRDADLVISGVGKTGVVRPGSLKRGACFIDFGFPPDADQAELASAADRLRFHTPTPGGTGPVLIAKLFENFFALS